MKYDFDQIIDRRKSDSVKWNNLDDRFGNADLLPMWVADTDFISPQPVIDALKMRAEHGIFGYTYKPDEFYDSVISWFSKRHQWSIDKEWISYSPGIVTGLTMLIRTFSKPGDSIVVQSPVYYPFFDIIEKNGCTVLDNTLEMNGENKYRIEFPDLEKKLADKRTKLMFICNPHNPIGRVWSEEELLKVGKLCVENDVIIISDEIHCDFVFKGHKFIPFMSLPSEISDNVISLVAPSKTFNLAGLKTSVVLSKNPDLLAEYNRMLDLHHVDGINCFGLSAIIAAYNQGEEYLEQMLVYLSENVNFLRDYLERHMPKVKMIEPEGTFLIWLDFREYNMSHDDLKEFFYQKAGVALSSGIVFGETGKGFMRMNIGCPRSVLMEGLEKIRSAMATL